jgi:hypothetical protein
MYAISLFPAENNSKHFPSSNLLLAQTSMFVLAPVMASYAQPGSEVVAQHIMYWTKKYQSVTVP